MEMFDRESTQILLCKKDKIKYKKPFMEAGSQP